MCYDLVAFEGNSSFLIKSWVFVNPGTSDTQLSIYTAMPSKSHTQGTTRLMWIAGEKTHPMLYGPSPLPHYWVG